MPTMDAQSEMSGRAYTRFSHVEVESSSNVIASGSIHARSSRSTPHDAGTRIVAAVDGSTEHQTALRGKDGVTRKGFQYTKCQSHDCEEKGCSAIES